MRMRRQYGTGPARGAVPRIFDENFPTAASRLCKIASLASRADEKLFLPKVFATPEEATLAA